MRLLNYFNVIVVLLFVVSCSNQGDDDVVTKAAITGSVNLYDEGTTKADNSGMTVKVEGLNPAISAVTNSNGKYELGDVPFGTYTLVFEKAGYGTFKKAEIKHVATGLPTVIAETPSLGQVSTTQITALSAKTEGGNLSVSVTTNPAGNAGNKRYIRFFYSGSPTVSAAEYLFASPAMIAQINPYTLTVSKTDLTGMGFATGATVYVRVYGDSFWSNEYSDAISRKKVYPNLNSNAAAAVSFVMP